MLVVKYLRSDQVFWSWVINKQTGSFLDQIDDLFRFIRRNRRTTVTSATELIHLQEIGTDIFRSMHYYIATIRPVIKTSFQPPDFQGKAIIPIISALGHIKTQ